MGRIKGDVKLPFVQDGRGALRWVADLIGTPAEQLARLHCHCCKQPVELRLEPGEPPHAVHAVAPRSGEGWVPDTEALSHEAAKVLLRDELRKVGTLFAVRCCAVCRTRQEFVLAKGWDSVESERPLGARRPDVLATVRGKPVLAIEVLRPREVRESTYAALDRRELPWIAVEAHEVVGAAWRGTDPLRAVRLSGPPWVCARCVARRAAEESRRGPVRALLDEEDETFDQGTLVASQSVSYRRAAEPSRSRYAPAGTLALRATATAVPLGSEDFTHASLERVMEIEVAGRRVRVDFNVCVRGAGDTDLLALTCRMMEGDQLGDPRSLATAPLSAAREPAGWLALMEHAQQAFAPQGDAPLTVAFDQGWKLERRGCACASCEAGRAVVARAPPRFPSRTPLTRPRGVRVEHEPQLVLFPEDGQG